MRWATDWTLFRWWWLEEGFQEQADDEDQEKKKWYTRQSKNKIAEGAGADDEDKRRQEEKSVTRIMHLIKVTLHALNKNVVEKRKKSVWYERHIQFKKEENRINFKRDRLIQLLSPNSKPTSDSSKNPIESLRQQLLKSIGKQLTFVSYPKTVMQRNDSLVLLFFAEPDTFQELSNNFCSLYQKLNVWQLIRP